MCVSIQYHLLQQKLEKEEAALGYAIRVSV